MNKNIPSPTAAGYPWLALLFLAIALPCLLSAQVGITYSLQGIGFSLEEGDVHYSFDVLARASESGTAIGTGIFYLEYPSLAFGSWINASGGLEVSQGELTTHPYFIYGLYTNDTSANVLAVTFEYQGIEGYGNALPETDTQLARIKLKLQDTAQPAQISFWPDQLSPAWQNLMEGQQFYDDNATVYDPVSAGAGLSETLQLSSQSIQLSQGWNLVSFWLQPLETDLLDIFGDLITTGFLKKVQDEDGNSMLQGLDGQWQNEIGTHGSQEGYYVDVATNCTLEVTGLEIPLPFVIELSPGWNIISYPCQIPQDALEALQGLISQGTLVKAQNESGASITQSLQGDWINEIGNLQAGEAYYVRVSDSCQLAFPARLDQKKGNTVKCGRSGARSGGNL